MVGVPEAQEIARAMENLLEELRERGVFPQALASLWLGATDALRSAVAGDTGVAEAAVRALSAGVDTSRAPQTNGHPPSRPATPPTRRQWRRRHWPLLHWPLLRPLLHWALLRWSCASRAERVGTARRADQGSLIRISAAKVDRMLDVVGETVLQSRRLKHLLTSDGFAAGGDERIEEALGQGDALLDGLQDSVIQMRTMPLSTITGSFPRAIRDLASTQGIEADLTIRGAETQLDRVILDGISETLTHLLRNAVAHGIEPPEERRRVGKPARGRIELSAEQRGSLVAIEVADDGRGVSSQLLQTTGDGLTDRRAGRAGLFDGRGDQRRLRPRGRARFGQDAYRVTRRRAQSTQRIRERHHRDADRPAHPFAAAGSAVQPWRAGFRTAARQRRGGRDSHSKLSLGGRDAIELRGHSVPLVDLADLIGATMPGLSETPHAVIIATSGRRLAAACDRIVEEQEVLVKSLGRCSMAYRATSVRRSSVMAGSR